MILCVIISQSSQRETGVTPDLNDADYNSPVDRRQSSFLSYRLRAVTIRLGIDKSITVTGADRKAVVMLRITHLEITSPDQWVRRSRAGIDIEVRECVPKQPRFNRFLYEYVGGDWRWIDRLVWPDQQWREYAANDNLRTFVAYRQGAVAGYYELQQQAGGSVEIHIFGLTPEFVGRGYGGPLLDTAIENAFAWGARRVWLHTCTFDHPNALNNYLKSGFQIFKVEEKVEPVLKGAP
jgi:GNAT superfamily N-acetyltransferase